MTLKQILNSLKKLFEPKRNNPVSLLDDKPLDNNFKSLKIGDKGSKLELSNEEINIPGTLYVKDLKISNTGTIDSVAISTDPDADSTHGLDDLSDVSYSGGDVKINSLDTLGPTDGTGAGNDWSIIGQNAQDTSEIGGDLIIAAGKGTGAAVGGIIYFKSSIADVGSASLNPHVTVGYIKHNGTLSLQSGTPANAGKFEVRDASAIIGWLTATATGGTGPDGDDLLLFANADIEINADGGQITFADDDIVFATFSRADSSFTLHEVDNDASLDYFRVACGANGATTISTVHAFAQLGNLFITPDGGLILSANGVLAYKSINCEDPLLIKEQADANTDAAGYGQIWVHDDAPNNLMFTDDDGQDIHLTKNTAVWGGGFARTTGANGKWLGIPTGHQGGYISFGTTDTAPDVTYNPTTTADDLGGVIWQSIHSIRVTACRIWYGEGGSSNTRHILCLMRYDIDSTGTLTNGVEVAGTDADGGSDDYTTLAFTDLTMTSDDTVTNAQVLIAMIYNSDLANAAMTAKCILEYQDLP